jgi:transposase-like protein
MSNTFARNKERTYAYECTHCKVIFLVKNESSRKSRGTKDYWKDKSIVRGKVVKVLVNDASDTD